MRVLILMLMLSGCSSAAVGTWSRTSETMSSAIRLNNSGTGELCTTRKGRRKGLTLTYSGDVIYINDSEIIIKFIGDGFLVIGLADSSNEDYIFKRDRRFKKRYKSCVK